MIRVSIFSILVLCSFSTASFTEVKTIQSGLSVDLIHRDSQLSPFHNPSLTPSQLIKNAALRSVSRSNHFTLSQNENKPPRTIITPDFDTGEYLLRFYIGTPPVERFAIMDTGSDLILVLCSPINCSPQNTPFFNPKNSSTFRLVSCDSQPCTLIPNYERSCGNSSECVFKDISITGILGVDSINFGSNGGGNAIKKFPKFTFGCAYFDSDNDINDIMKNTNTKPKITGLVGLGAGPLSIISQLGDEIGHKFSYCLLPLGSNSTSKLKFGNEAKLKGKGVVSTPLIIKSSESTFYYLNLEGISVGGKMVKKGQSQTQGNMVIDSGTTFTILQQSFYNRFVDLVKEVFGVKPIKNPPEEYHLCFRKEDINIDDGINDFVFHFTGAMVRMKAENLFSFPNDKLICMMVQPTSEDGVSILGNQAQIGFQVEYDLEEGKVSFAPADCTEH